MDEVNPYAVDEIDFYVMAWKECQDLSRRKAKM